MDGSDRQFQGCHGQRSVSEVGRAESCELRFSNETTGPTEITEERLAKSLTFAGDQCPLSAFSSQLSAFSVSPVFPVVDHATRLLNTQPAARLCADHMLRGCHRLSRGSIAHRSCPSDRKSTRLNSSHV